MNPSDAQVFVRVVRAGSFSEAAKQLGVTRSATSKAVSRLEADLNVVLLRRTPRSLSMTDAGTRFFRFADEADEALRHGVAAVRGADSEVVGHLAVTMPTSLGAALMPRLVQRFRREWPRLTLSLDFDDCCIDLIGKGFDLAIRIAAQLEDSSLRSKPLASTREVVVASPGYLRRSGTPAHVADLKAHRCLSLGRPMQRDAVWRFLENNQVIEVSVGLSLTTNIDLPLILATCIDDGILQIPRLLVGGELDSGRLVEILSEFADPRKLGIYAVYPERNPPAKVKAFIDFVASEIHELGRTDRWAPFSNSDDPS